MSSAAPAGLLPPAGALDRPPPLTRRRPAFSRHIEAVNCCLIGALIVALASLLVWLIRTYP